MKKLKTFKKGQLKTIPLTKLMFADDIADIAIPANREKKTLNQTVNSKI